jgi:hypothetical protein
MIKTPIFVDNNQYYVDNVLTVQELRLHLLQNFYFVVKNVRNGDVELSNDCLVENYDRIDCKEEETHYYEHNNNWEYRCENCKMKLYLDSWYCYHSPSCIEENETQVDIKVMKQG